MKRGNEGNVRKIDTDTMLQECVYIRTHAHSYQAGGKHGLVGDGRTINGWIRAEASVGVGFEQ